MVKQNSTIFVSSSRNYKFHNPDGSYFITFAVVEWVNVFTRMEFKNMLIDSSDYFGEKGILNDVVVIL